MAGGNTLVQWQATGCHVALHFDQNERFVKITHQYAQYAPAPSGCLSIVIFVLGVLTLLLSTSATHSQTSCPIEFQKVDPHSLPFSSGLLDSEKDPWDHYLRIEYRNAAPKTIIAIRFGVAFVDALADANESVYSYTSDGIVKPGKTAKPYWGDGVYFHEYGWKMGAVAWVEKVRFSDNTFFVDDGSHSCAFPRPPRATTAESPAASGRSMQPYRSADGRFTVNFPQAEVKQKSHTIDLRGGGTTTMYQFWVELADSQVSYMVMYNDYAADNANGDPQSVLATTRNGVVGGKTLLSDMAISLNGVPGREFTAKDDTWNYTVRQFLQGKRLYQLIIVSNNDHPATQISEFLNSFKIL